MSKPYGLLPEWRAFATQTASLEPAPPRILWPSREEVRRIIEEAEKTCIFPITRTWRPEECAWLAGAVAPASPGAAVPDDVAALIEEYRRVGVELLPAKTSDPDGPLVPLPAKPAPERVVPPLPFTAYQAMLRG